LHQSDLPHQSDLRSHSIEPGSIDVKKGRHRRFEEARALKRTTETIVEPCPECGADPDDEHASWCLAGEDDDSVDELGADG
jgi:hypothetical protein